MADERKSITFRELPLAQQIEIVYYLSENYWDAKIKELAWCESRQKSHIKVWDVGSYSFGYLQFKLGTFLGFGKKYQILPEEITQREALLLIYNENIQTEIAREMLADGLWYHWKNCGIRIGLNKLPNKWLALLD